MAIGEFTLGTSTLGGSDVLGYLPRGGGISGSRISLVGNEIASMPTRLRLINEGEVTVIPNRIKRVRSF